MDAEHDDGDLEANAKLPWENVADIPVLELNKALRRALKSQRNAEVRLQLQMQKLSSSESAAGRLLQANEELIQQVDEIRGRLLESKLQNVRLKSELHSRREIIETTILSKCGKLKSGVVGCFATCTRCAKGMRREGREVCTVVLVLLILLIAMVAFFNIVMA